KKCMNIYARALEERGIPFEITGSDAFSDSEDIQELVNLARALRDPDNPVLTVGVLRGIFFGLSDNDLLLYRKAGGRFSFLKEIIELEGGEGVQRVIEALGVLRKWWRWTKEYSPSVALEKICEDSGIVNYLAASEMGSSKAGNVFKLLEFLRGRERDGVTDFPGIVLYMEELIEVHEVQEMSLTPGRVCAVRLMNLHKAKGLEAPVVFLANPVGTRDHAPDKHVVRTDVGGPEGYFLFSKRMWFTEKLLSQPLGWEERSEEEGRYAKAEEERLMYVAATRAKNMMVISSYAGGLPNRSWELLDKNLSDVPELDIPAPGDIVTRKKASFPAEKYEGIRKSLEENFERAGQPSYFVESVTSMAKVEGEKPGWSEGGLGMSWGRMVHYMLDVLGRGEDVDLDLVAGNALVAEERDLSEKGKLLDLIGAITESEFWGRMMRAEKKFFEMPFSLKTEGEDKRPVIVSGTIDLIFKEEDGWVIVDYKTDEITGDIQVFVDYYAPQVRLYSDFWQQITGETVKESALYFTSVKKLIEIH
ncbi:UvrD-helicase domain-containing protein, partial [Acidobacteriota bacterium]